MSSPVNFSKIFTFADCFQLVRQEAGTIVPPISPLFYEVLDHSGNLRGCLLGSAHDLIGFGHTFRDMPSVFSPNSRVQRCFERAQAVFTEVNSQDAVNFYKIDPVSIEEYQRETMEGQNMDSWFEVAALIKGKQSSSLEPPADRETPELLSAQAMFTQMLDTEVRVKCNRDMLRRLESEERLIEYENTCVCPQLRNDFSRRNQIMARTIHTAAQQQLFFAIMGASHLPGPNGVCERLRRDGWKVEKISD